MHNGRKGVIQQDHGGELARNVRATQAHGDADVGLPQRRCVVNAIARHSDDLAGVLISAHQRQLLLWTNAGENVGLKQVTILSIGEPCDVTTFKHVGSAAAKPDGLADAPRCYRVITGDHNHANTGVLAIFDGLRHIGACRVLKSNKSEECQILIWRDKGLHLDFHGAAEHSKATTRELLNMGEPLAARSGIQRGRTLGRDYFRGSVQYRLRRAFDGD